MAEIAVMVAREGLACSGTRGWRHRGGPRHGPLLGSARCGCVIRATTASGPTPLWSRSTGQARRAGTASPRTRLQPHW